MDEDELDRIIQHFQDCPYTRLFNRDIIKKKPAGVNIKSAAAVLAVVRRTRRVSRNPLRSSSAPSVNVDAVTLQECPEEFDETPREARFAFRTTDLDSWNSSSSPRHGEENTNRDPTTIQHWALVVHFPEGNKTYLFEAVRENGYLQAGRAENVNKEVFAYATYFGRVETSPSKLLEKAKQVPTGEYHVALNNCQTWLMNFLDLISPKLSVVLQYRSLAHESSLVSIWGSTFFELWKMMTGLFEFFHLYTPADKDILENISDMELDIYKF